jgi:hypothetical protein
MMKKLLLIAAAIVAIASPALAADIATKAPIFPAIPTAYPYQSSGLIFGLYTEGGGGSVTASAPGVNPASLTSTDASLGATIGYVIGQKGSQFAYSFEADFGFTNFNGNNAGFALSGPLDFKQRFVVWTPFSNLTALLPNLPNIFGSVPPFPVLPTGVTASNIQSGLGFGIEEKDVSLSFAGVQANKEWLIMPTITPMMMEQLSNGTALREYVSIGIPTQGHFVGPIPGSTATLGPQIKAGVGVAF